MSAIQREVNEPPTESSSQSDPGIICCFLEAPVSRWTSLEAWSAEHVLAAQALQLLISLDCELRGARADWNHDRFRRVMQARSRAVTRVQRRWHRLDPAPAIGLGTLRRRYHANLGRYLYQARESAITDL